MIVKDVFKSRGFWMFFGGSLFGTSIGHLFCLDYFGAAWFGAVYVVWAFLMAKKGFVKESRP
jgi:hypothetical protein